MVGLLLLKIITFFIDNSFVRCMYEYGAIAFCAGYSAYIYGSKNDAG